MGEVTGIRGRPAESGYRECEEAIGEAGNAPEALLRDIARLLERRADRDARASGLSAPRWRLLVQLSRNEGISQSALADSLKVVPISVARIADRLAAAGLIERRAHPTDRRAWLLYLTPLARAQLETMENAAEFTGAEIVKGISSEERRQFVATLLRVKSNLSTTPER